LLPKPEYPKWGNACPIPLSHKGVGGFTTQSDGMRMFLHVAWVTFPKRALFGKV
jgi:hypothetical protein